MPAMSLAAALLAVLPGTSLPLPIAADARSVCIKDVDFALEALQQKCGHFFASKKIDWAAVTTEFRAAAKNVKDEREHLGLSLIHI